MSEGGVRSGATSGDIGPDDARALLDAFFDSIGMDLRGRDLIDHMQSDEFSHAELERRARRVHERKLNEVVERTVADLAGDEPVEDLAGRAIQAGSELSAPRCRSSPTRRPRPSSGRRRAKLNPPEGAARRVALVADAIGGVHGVSHTIERLRELGVPGWDVEVIGTDRSVDRRLPAAAEVEVPFYAGLAGRRPEPPRDGRDDRRGPLRRDPRHGARARPGCSAPSSPGSWSCRCSAAGTPSSAPTRASAPAPRTCSAGRTWRSRSSTASAATS